MKTNKPVIQALAVFLLIIVLAGCSPATPQPTADLQPTLNAVRTEAARTVIADMTRSAPAASPTLHATPTPTAMPTSTPTASSTPSPTPTITATYIPWTATPTQAAFSCIVTSFSPALNATIAPDSDFDATWVIKNTGKQTWIRSDIDIFYSSGTKLQKLVDGLDLKNDVASGESYTAAVDMHTPTTAGTYSTTWVVGRGSEVFCSMMFTIIVK